MELWVILVLNYTVSISWVISDTMTSIWHHCNVSMKNKDTLQKLGMRVFLFDHFC